MDRRRFLQAGAAAAGVLSATSCRSSQPRWRFFSDPEGRTLAALCDQIVPPDDYPGAARAGAVEFIDRQLMRHYRKHRAAYRQGLAETDQISIGTFGHPFASLAFAQQTEIVHVLEGQRRPFFDLLLNHTMQSFYGSPRHGGNRDAVSWRMLGVPEPPVRGRSQFDGGGPARS
jgi:gluconate 2-dehydrogenase gamma chain